MKYNMLTWNKDVKSHMYSDGQVVKKSLWRCDCGASKEIVNITVKRGHTKS